MTEWRPISEMDTERNNRCSVRCRHGKVMKDAIWGEFPTRSGQTMRAWMTPKGVFGLHDFASFKLHFSLPMDKSDEALVADRNIMPITSPILLGEAH